MPKTDRNTGSPPRRSGDARKTSPRAKASLLRPGRAARESRSGKASGPAAARTPGVPTQAARRPITQEERHRLIAEAAYYKAQERGFEGDLSEKDWLEAEAEVDARLLRESGGGASGDGD